MMDDSVRCFNCHPRRPTARNADRFAYNRRGEVASATVAGEPSTYTYDGIGNFTTLTGGAVTNVYAANELNQYEEVTSSGTTIEPTYTSNGELASFGDWTYAYDALSRLTAAYSNGTLVVSNRYDHLGRRVQKIAPDGTHTFLYDGWRPVVETVARVGGGTDRIEYYWGKDFSGSLDGAAGVGGLLYVKRNGAIYVPFYDAFGNVMGYWDEQGNVVAEYAYDAFGRTVAKNGTMADVFSIRYSTKYYDAETGMYYYGKRYYFLELYRWLTRDPIEEQGGVNLYAFCGNDGLVFVDPFGELFYVVKHFPTISPPGGWLTPCAQAETVFTVPRYRIKEKNDVGGKIRFEIDLVPEDMRVDVYFRSGASSIWSMAYEYDHIAYARQMYHAALILKKAILDICDCPVPALKAKVVLEDEFKMTIKRLIQENAALDRKGGKHDLPYRKSPFGDN